MARTSPQVRDSRVIQVFFKRQRCHSCSPTSPQLPTRPPGLAILFMVTPRRGDVLPGASPAVFLRDAQCTLSYGVRRPERRPAVRSLDPAVQDGLRAARAVAGGGSGDRPRACPCTADASHGAGTALSFAPSFNPPTSSPPRPRHGLYSRFSSSPVSDPYVKYSDAAVTRSHAARSLELGPYIPLSIYLLRGPIRTSGTEQRSHN